MPFDSHQTPARQLVLYIHLNANWRQILQHAVMQKTTKRQHVASRPPDCRATLCKLLMCCWLVLLTSGDAWAALLSDSPNDLAHFEETVRQRSTPCDLSPDELPEPTAPDIVAKQLRQTIQRTQDAALQAKLRNAYLHYLGCQADISRED